MSNLPDSTTVPVIGANFTHIRQRLRCVKYLRSMEGGYFPALFRRLAKRFSLYQSLFRRCLRYIALSVNRVDVGFPVLPDSCSSVPRKYSRLASSLTMEYPTWLYPASTPSVIFGACFVVSFVSRTVNGLWRTTRALPPRTRAFALPILVGVSGVPSQCRIHA